MAILPWFYLPFDGISLGLIILECLLFFIYSFPLSRFKKKGIVGALINAQYSFVIPAVLVSWTFYLVGGKTFPNFAPFLSIVIFWQFILGVRSVLSDRLNNQMETITSVTFFGKVELKKVLYTTLILELVTFLVLSVFLYSISEWYALGLIVFSLAALSNYYIFKKHRNAPGYSRISSIFLDSFYFQWFASILLVAIIPLETEITYIFITHLVVFRNVFKTVAKAIIDWFSRSYIKRFFYDFESYTKGLLIHVSFMILYFIVFSAAYYWLESNENDFNTFNWQQHLLSNGLIVMIFCHLTTIVILRRRQVAQTIQQFFLEKGSPYNLSVFRIIMFWIILGSIYGEVFGDFEKWTHLPYSEREGLPFIGWLIEILPITPELYMAMGKIALVLAVLILVGFQTRWALLIYVPIALYLWGVPNFYGKLNHRHIMVWVPMILAFSKCSEVLSVDAFIAKLRGTDRDLSHGVQFMLPFKMIWLILAVIYCCSGLHKLWDTGLYWALSDNLANQIQLEWVENYDTVSSIRVDRYPIFLKIMAVGVIIMEIIYPLLILHARTRIIALFSAWSLHISAGYFLYIDFFHLRIVHLSYINWVRIKSWLTKGKDKIYVVYDNNANAFLKLRRMPLLYVGIFIVGTNLVFGIAQINTWPFSSYPAYSSIVPDKVDLLEMYAIDGDGKSIDVKRIAKNAKFRWETIRPFEQRIAEEVKKGETAGVQDKLEAYWQLWMTKVDSLSETESVAMYLETTSVVPEKRDVIIDRIYLGTVYVQHEE